MITTKAIEKTKFFTTNGSDIWKVKKIDEITAVELVNCESGKSGTCVLGEDDAKKFHPVRMPRIEGRGTRGEGRVKKAQKKKEKAAVADHLGNKEEAARLRTIVEKKTKEKINQVEGATAWDCTGCGKGYPYKPDRCGKCGSSSFAPAAPEERR